MADLAALQQLIQQQAVAEGEVQGLEQQRANAMALRDSPVQQAGRRSGYSSPLSHIANVLNSYSGSKMQAEAAPKIAAGQQAIAEGQAAQKNYALQKAADAVAYQKQQDADDLGLKTEQEAYRRDQTAKKQGLEAAALKASQEKLGDRTQAWNLETGDPVQTYIDPVSGVLTDSKGEAIDDTTVTFTDPAITKQRAGGGKNPLAWSGPRREKFENDAVQANTVTGMISGFDPEYASPSDFPLSGATSNFLATNAGPLSTEAMKERQAWWSDYKANYELVTRHGLFGSALTKNEANEWKKSSINPDMTPDQISKNLAKMQEIIDRKAAKQAGNASMAGLSDEYIEHNLAGLTPEEYRAKKEVTQADLEEEAAQPPEEVPLTNSQGWQLLVDGQGNRAYVGPNGEIEEVQ